MNETINSPLPAEAAGQSEEEQKKKRKWPLLLLLILLLCGAMLIGLYLFGVFDSDKSDLLIGSGVQSGSPDSTTAGADGENGIGTFSISINAYPVFPDGESEGSLNIVNPNTNSLSITVEITLNDTGETIYESGVIPPNHYIGNDKLIKVLEAGEYEAKASVTPYDPDNPDRVFNRSNFNLVLIVEN